MKLILHTFISLRSLLLFLFFGISSLLFNRAAEAQSWEPVGSVDFISSIVNYPNIVLDGNGTLYVAFNETIEYTGTSVYKFNGMNWEAVGTKSFSTGIATEVSLAIDNSGVVYVVYQDRANSRKATVMKFNGTSWQVVGTAGFSPAQANHTTIAIYNGTPYVAYLDYANSYKATVMKFNGTNWEAVGQTGFSTGESTELSMEIDKNGTIYVAYMDGTNSNKASVMKFNGVSWEVVGLPGFSAGKAYDISFAIDKSGTPYVVYSDGGNGIKLTVMKYNGWNWQTVGEAGFSAGIAYSPSIAINNNGTPYVVFTDVTNENKVTGMKYNGIFWQEVGQPGFSTGSIANSSITIDASGTLYVLYIDRSPTVMKFTNQVLPITLTDFKGKMIQNTAALTWSTSSEQSNDYFAVQRSADGVHFTTIGKVEGKGGTRQNSAYSFSDHHPILNAANYYRLCQVDLDGRQQLSKTITLHAEGRTSSISVYPNPAQDYLQLRIPANETKVSVEIYDASGQLHRNQTYQHPSAQIQIEISGLVPGIYQVIVTKTNGTSESVRFIKQ